MIKFAGSQLAADIHAGHVYIVGMLHAANGKCATFDGRQPFPGKGREGEWRIGGAAA